jgi:uncharacterized protein YeaO (DUF488 family)
LQFNPTSLRAIWQQLNQATQSLDKWITEASPSTDLIEQIQNEQSLITDFNKRNMNSIQDKQKLVTHSNEPVPTSKTKNLDLLKFF